MKKLHKGTFKYSTISQGGMGGFKISQEGRDERGEPKRLVLITITVMVIRIGGEGVGQMITIDHRGGV